MQTAQMVALQNSEDFLFDDEIAAATRRENAKYAVLAHSQEPVDDSQPSGLTATGFDGTDSANGLVVPSDHCLGMRIHYPPKSKNYF